MSLNIESTKLVAGLLGGILGGMLGAGVVWFTIQDEIEHPRPQPEVITAAEAQSTPATPRPELSQPIDVLEGRAALQPTEPRRPSRGVAPQPRPRTFVPPEPVEPESPPPVIAETLPPASVEPDLTASAPPDLPTEMASLDTSAGEATQLPALDMAPPQPRSLTIPAGTLIGVRLSEYLDSDRNIAGDSFQATLSDPVVIDGWVIAERGAIAYGRVVDAERAGRIRGTSALAIRLESFEGNDGQRVYVNTATFTKNGATSKKQDAAKVGMGAAIGAALGAILGGGKGAAIGAATGGAAGGGAVIATRGKAAALDPETRLRFRIDKPVTITER